MRMMIAVVLALVVAQTSLAQDFFQRQQFVQPYCPNGQCPNVRPVVSALQTVVQAPVNVVKRIVNAGEPPVYYRGVHNGRNALIPVGGVGTIYYETANGYVGYSN